MDAPLTRAGLPAGVPGAGSRPTSDGPGRATASDPVEMSWTVHVAVDDPTCPGAAGPCQATDDPPVPVSLQSGGPLLPSSTAATPKSTVVQSGGPLLPTSGYDVGAMLIVAAVALAVGSILSTVCARRSTWLRRSRRRRPDVTTPSVVGAVMVVGVVLASVMALMAAVASAHAPIIDATTSCRPTASSPWTVRWSVRNSETIPIRVMTIEHSTLLQAASSWDPPVPTAVAPGATSIASSTHLASTPTVTLQIDGLWQYEGTTIRRTELATIDRPGICPASATTSSAGSSSAGTSSAGTPPPPSSASTTTPTGPTVPATTTAATTVGAGGGPTGTAATATSVASGGPTSLLASEAPTGGGAPAKVASGGPLLPATGGSLQAAAVLGVLGLLVGAAAVRLARRRPAPAASRAPSE